MRGRVLVVLLATVWGATAAGGCARTMVYACGVHFLKERSARVAVRAYDRGRFALDLVEVNGPVPASRVCSPPGYAFGEDATELELRPGRYRLLAKAERAADPWAFPLRGEISVEAGRCYEPAMACDGAPPDAGGCRLTLAPVACPARWFPRRQVVTGVSAC